MSVRGAIVLLLSIVAVAAVAAGRGDGAIEPRWNFEQPFVSGDLVYNTAAPPLRMCGSAPQGRCVGHFVVDDTKAAEDYSWLTREDTLQSGQDKYYYFQFKVEAPFAEQTGYAVIADWLSGRVSTGGSPINFDIADGELRLIVRGSTRSDRSDWKQVSAVVMRTLRPDVWQNVVFRYKLSGFAPDGLCEVWTGEVGKPLRRVVELPEIRNGYVYSDDSGEHPPTDARWHVGLKRLGRGAVNADTVTLDFDNIGRADSFDEAASMLGLPPTPPTFVGTPQPGHTLYATEGGWPLDRPVLQPQWQRCDADGRCVAIVDRRNRYRSTSADVGDVIRFCVVAGGLLGPSPYTYAPWPQQPYTGQWTPGTTSPACASTTIESTVRASAASESPAPPEP